MFNHEPPNYKCPFCELRDGVKTELNSKSDVVFENDHVIATVAPKWWAKNHGHVLVIPKHHYENIYDMPDKILGEVYAVVKKISIAIKNTYGCDGTSNRQHNEPAGNQYVWHFHTHVFPRYDGDELYQNHNNKKLVSVTERKVYADKLKAYLEQQN